jgi:hypothetical protein
VDLGRNEILRSELCGFTWHFAFRQEETYIDEIQFCKFDQTTLRNVLYPREVIKSINFDVDEEALDLIYNEIQENFMWEFLWDNATRKSRGKSSKRNVNKNLPTFAPSFFFSFLLFSNF